MHDTAYEIAKLFFETYFAADPDLILEIGSQNINGSLRDCAPRGSTYIGVDLARGDGVDIALDDPHSLPFADEQFDATIASSCFEHDQMFWLTFLEMVRVTKTGGYVYLNVPSNGWYHAYPFDNWRFYPDAGLALTAWARHQGCEVALMESFIARRKADIWNDCVIVFRREDGETPTPAKIADQLPDSYNICRHDGSRDNVTMASEDMLLLDAAKAELGAKEREIARLTSALDDCRETLSALAAKLCSALGREECIAGRAATAEGSRSELPAADAPVAAIARPGPRPGG